MTQLTAEELKTLINIVAKTSVPVSQAPELIALINKMSQMIDQSSVAKPAGEKP
jgi:hypothetical protein